MRAATASITLLIMSGGCSSDFLDTEPTGSLSQDQQDNVAVDDPIKAFSPIISGLYNSMVNYYGYHDEFGHPTIFLATDLMGNDMVQLANQYFYFYYQMIIGCPIIVRRYTTGQNYIIH